MSTLEGREGHPDRQRHTEGAAPIRVLWLIKGLGPGGAERLLVAHAAVRDRRSFEYRAAYLVPWKDQLVGELEGLDVPVTLLDARREWDLRWASRLRRLVTETRPEVVHTHSPYVASVARVVLRGLPRARRPVLVHTEHNRWPRHRLSTRILNGTTCRFDDHTLAVSEDVRATMSRRCGARTEVLVHGVDLEGVRAHRRERAAVRAELGIAPDEIVIGSVANLRREKAHDVLLRAAARTRTTGRPIRFVSVGQGPLEDSIRALHRELDLGERFLVLGHRPDAVRVMSAFDVFTLSSRHEGLPVSLMEALALGIPVVATAVGGIPQAITDGREGLLVRPAAPEALAAAYDRVVDDDDLRSRLAAAAMARGDDFAIEDAVARLEELYAAQRAPALSPSAEHHRE